MLIPKTMVVEQLRARGDAAGAARADREQVVELLRAVSPAALGGEAPAHVIGVTGPPGAGKSTLLGEL